MGMAKAAGTLQLAPATDFAGHAQSGPKGFDRRAYQQQ
jgi:hypothetical protein